MEEILASAVIVELICVIVLWRDRNYFKRTCQEIATELFRYRITDRERNNGQSV